MVMHMGQGQRQVSSDAIEHASHELRTPVTGIVGMLELLASSRLDDDQRELVSAASCSAKHLLDVIGATLDHASARAGVLQLKDEPFDLREVVRQVNAIVSNAAQSKGLQVHVSLAERLPSTVSGDSTRVRQILVNLLGNAIKYSGRGVVRLTVEPGFARGVIVFGVTDDGPGIAPEDRTRIFEPFARATHEDGRTGTGLGLPLARQLARAMHGDLVLVPSERGGYFRATLRLPSVHPAAASPRRRWLATRRLRILLADDDLANQIIARRVLERMGHEVKVVSDGASALEALCRESYDLAILDIEMPGATGLEVVRSLRGREVTTPVVGFTAHESPAHRVRCLDAGMVDVLLKPVDAEQFAAVVSSTAGRSLVAHLPR